MILVLAAAALLNADLETSVEIMGLTTATRDDAGNLVFGLLAKGDLTFTAIANSNVKAVTEILGYWSGSLFTNPADLLKRLYVKVDFGGLTALVGKARVTWGEGFVFNAGDVVFGSLTPLTNLTQSQLRDQTDWLADLTLYLGSMTYVEGIFLPYSPLSPAGLPYTDVYHLRGGGRFVTDLGGLKIETGYLFKADEAIHHPYLSLHGSLFFDFDLSAALKIPAVDYTDDKLKRGLELSAGLFRMFQFDDGGVLTIRLEAAVRPFGLWEKAAVPSDPALYGLLLYPEITYSPGSDVSIQLRAMINPIDGSGMASAGLSFGIYQGFTLVCFASGMWGDGSDTVFSFDRPGDLAFSAGLDFIY